MINWHETLFFPVRDAEARKQFLFACLVVLAGFIIPILPTLLLIGYSARIMRQILEDRKSPFMPNWQESNWSDMLMDGLRLFGVQITLTLPLFLIMGCGFVFMLSGSVGISALADESTNSFAPISGLFFLIGIGLMVLFSLLSFPYGIIMSAALPHTVAKNSFSAGLNFKEWLPIFRKGLANFIFGYLIIMAVTFVYMFVIQIALITVILICIIPLLTIPLTAYITLTSTTIYAQAYVAGRDALQSEQHATA